MTDALSLKEIETLFTGSDGVFVLLDGIDQ